MRSTGKKQGVLRFPSLGAVAVGSLLLAMAVTWALWAPRWFVEEFQMPEQFPTLAVEEIEQAGAQPKAAEAAPAVATFGGGCFWCTEAVFQQLRGVLKVESGYSGGQLPNPTYQAICTGLTGHAEVIQITYDPAQISFADLLEVFWRTHDPTTLNRQGHDVGTQYRSVIFYHSPEQRELAELYKRKINAAEAYPRPVVTEISPFAAFYPAEREHHNYFADNPQQSYCRAVIQPKVEKFREIFASRLRDAP